MKAFKTWLTENGYQITDRGQYRKGNLTLSLDELAEIFTDQKGSEWEQFELKYIKGMVTTIPFIFENTGI